MAETPAGDRGLRVLVIDDEEKIRVTLAMCLEVEGHLVKSCGNMDSALEELARQVFDLIFLDVRLGVHNGLDYLSRIRSEFPWATVVVITAYASVATAIRAMKLGATDYLPKPFTPAQVQLVTEKVIERRQLDLKIAALQAALGTLDPESELPTDNPEMQRALELARQVADSNANVHICGEIGTGRGRLARAIHTWSRRAQGPFASVVCDTTSADELDAELFGLTRSPGQPSLDIPGRLELCDGGSITLEDIAGSPPSLQPKLYRLLKDKEYERHNDFKVRRANARMICTSSLDPEDAVRRRRLRPELLLALDVVRIQIPPLRNRPEDIRSLARRYLAYFGRENRRAIAGFTTDALTALKRYHWPGNNRELRNLIERAVILCDSDEIGSGGGAGDRSEYNGPMDEAQQGYPSAARGGIHCIHADHRSEA
jgi:NtrC-family two-component system response regulator AlgB